MHELSIAQKIIEIVQEHAQKNKISKVHSVKLKIGKMSAFQKEQLEFCLNTYEKNPVLADMQFEITEVPVELACNSCGKHYIDSRFEDADFAHDIAHAPTLYLPPPCPSCKAESVNIASGREMELISIEGE